MQAPGTRLGPYEIEESVGAGGMGEVYRARDTRLDRRIAIKVLPGHLSDDPERRQRFEREARAISNLQHPNICTLYDIGHEEGIDFLVMEYLEGETLAARLQRGSLSVEEMLTNGIQITDALDAAHRSGVVHRDLKPGNVILTRTGAKLLDFGLARMSTGEGSPSHLTELRTETDSRPLTEQGTILGTFQYMSPEQLEGGVADSRSDIFSLGAVLYEMATGRKAFEGRSQASLIASIMRSAPQPISTLQPMTPPALDRVIRTCLEKDPQDRWQTAHDVALQLKWIREGGSEAGIPKPVAARRRGRERTAWLLAGVASIAALALASLQLLRPSPEPPRTVRFSIEAPNQVTSFGSPRISPDGRVIAFNGTDSQGETTIWLRPLESFEAHSLAGTEGCGRPFWSPDSRHVGFFAGGRLKRVPIAGGPPVTLCQFENGADGSWGAEYILFDGATGDSINAVPVGGGAIRGASTLDRERGDTSHGWPYFLPDGRRFLFIVMKPGPDEIHLGEIGSLESKMITPGDSRVEYVPPGYLIYEREGTLLAQPFDTDAEKVTGDAFALAEGIGEGVAGLAHFSGSASGTLIYTKGEPPERKLVWFDRSGRELGTVGGTARYRHPALSPDGTRLAVEITSPAGPTDLWLLDIRRGTQSRFTFESENSNPTWSPDGSELAFVSDRSGTSAVYVKNASGTGAVRRLTNLPYPFYVTQWTADGRLVGTSLRPETSFDVSAVSVDRPDSIRHYVAGSSLEAQGRASPDGRFVAYTSGESGHGEVYVIRPGDGGGKWQVSTGGGSEAMWRGDGRELFYLAADRSLMAVDVTPGKDLVLGLPQKLFSAPVQRDAFVRNRYLVTPDGQRFLMVALVQPDRVPPTNVILNWAAELRER